MKVIENENALKQVSKAEAIIVDVRERAEYLEGHLVNSINLPLSEFSVAPYELFPGQKFCLLCNSQNRAKQAYNKLTKLGFDNAYIMQEGYEQMTEAPQKNTLSNSWTIDRQFRMTLGLLLVIFLIGYKIVGNSFLIIPIILATGLVFTSIIDRCYMRMGIALLPWNRSKKL